MATFVLVHSASMGGWCWREVADLLRARGHEVVCPTLTGMGERKHLRVEGIQTHVTDLAETLMFRDLHEVHLVLHGYAGALAGPLAARTARIASVTYLAGCLVPSGQPVPATEPADLGITDPSLRAWALPRLTPWSPGTQQVHYDPGPLAELRAVYIRTTEPPVAALEPSWRQAFLAGWETHEITSGFAAMIAAPRQTARLLEVSGPADGLPPVFPASPRIALW